MADPRVPEPAACDTSSGTYGTNDLAFDADPTMDAVATMADQAAQAGVRMILCLIPPQTRTGETLAYDGYTGDAAVRAWNRDLSLLAAAHGDQVADYDSVLVNPDGTQNQALFMPDDGIHPNSAGFAAMWPVLEPLLGADGVAMD
ncbi:MAG TPA: GDSL-type esterase/lipase family protein [Steroidobacteraceae bacterium]|nr:GDSL-type esterase/lipase family protein [Steroidobacteraceae bacterium]